MFKVGQRLSVQTDEREGQGGRYKRKVNCEVVGVYPHFIVVKGKNYKESFLLSNFLTGDYKVIGGIN